jgi:hypothetical protein
VDIDLNFKTEKKTSKKKERRRRKMQGLYSRQKSKKIVHVEQIHMDQTPLKQVQIDLFFQSQGEC